MRHRPNGTAGSIAPYRPANLPVSSGRWRLKVASFPTSAIAGIKSRVNAIGLPDEGDFVRDSELFLESAARPETQSRIRTALQNGLQTREGELDFGCLIKELA